MRASTPPICTHCQSTKSPLWRRGAQQEVLCNACGLYWKHHGCYRPLSLKVAADRKQESSSSLDGTESMPAASKDKKELAINSFMKFIKSKKNLTENATSNSSVSRNQDSRKASSGPLRTANILLAPSQYGYENTSKIDENTDLSLNPLLINRPDLSTPLPPPSPITAAPVLPNLKTILESHHQQQQKQKRAAIGSLVSAEAASSAPSAAPLKFIINKGKTMYQGDHVAVLGDDSQVYFAILSDFWLTQNGRRFCTLRWLLPIKVKPLKKDSETQTLSADNFTLGPVHERVEAMDAILDVFYSPHRNGQSSEEIRKRFLCPSSNEKNSEDVAVELLAKMTTT